MKFSRAPFPTPQPPLKALFASVGATEKDRFIPTSSHVEALNNVPFSTYLEVTRKSGKHHLLTVSTQFQPLKEASERLSNLGCITQIIEIEKEGILSYDHLLNYLTPRTALLSLPLSNPFTGALQPTSEIAALCQERGILFHLDITDALLSESLSWQELGADILTCGEGIFIKEKMRFSPLVVGHEPSTEWFESLEKKAQERIEKRTLYTMQVAHIKQTFEERAKKEVGKIHVFHKEQLRLPHLTSLQFEGVHSEALAYLAFRSGLEATPHTSSNLSFLFHPDLTHKEIDQAIAILKQGVEPLRRMSEALL